MTTPTKRETETERQREREREDRHNTVHDNTNNERERERERRQDKTGPYAAMFPSLMACVGRVNRQSSVLERRYNPTRNDQTRHPSWQDNHNVKTITRQGYTTQENTR
jgi:hypothetical protein